MDAISGGAQCSSVGPVAEGWLLSSRSLGGSGSLETLPSTHAKTNKAENWHLQAFGDKASVRKECLPDERTAGANSEIEMIEALATRCTLGSI